MHALFLWRVLHGEIPNDSFGQNFASNEKSLGFRACRPLLESPSCTCSRVASQDPDKTEQRCNFLSFLLSDLISNITCKLPNHILLRSSRQCGETIQHSVPQQTILCSDVREIPSQWDFSVQLPWKLDCAWTGRLRFPQWHLFHFLHSCTETPPSSPGTLLWF